MLSEINVHQMLEGSMGDGSRVSHGAEDSVGDVPKDGS